MQLQLVNSWFNAEGETEGQYFFIRGRDTLSNIIESSLYTDRIEISWKYDTSNASFYPSDKEALLMEKFEDATTIELESDLHSLLAFVYTGNGTRVWHWYTRSFNDFPKRLDKALLNLSEVPIEIKRFPDPDWSEYLEMMSNRI